MFITEVVKCRLQKRDLKTPPARLWNNFEPSVMMNFRDTSLKWIAVILKQCLNNLLSKFTQRESILLTSFSRVVKARRPNFLEVTKKTFTFKHYGEANLLFIDPTPLTL